MSKYFTIAELCKSETADRLGIPNRVPKALLPNLQALIDHVLDPLREWYGRPIYVNSGYRCAELNRAVGGVQGSFHVRGMAADIDVHDAEENRKLFDHIKNHLPFTELGWEGGGAWIHVAYDKDRLNREIFQA